VPVVIFASNEINVPRKKIGNGTTQVHHGSLREEVPFDTSVSIAYTEIEEISCKISDTNGPSEELQETLMRPFCRLASSV